jgi:drug/metabolite transporter (DMT)-like permease
MQCREVEARDVPRPFDFAPAALRSGRTVNREPTPFLRAAGLMLASTLSFGLMAVVIRLVSRDLATTEIAFFRNLFGLLVLLPLLWRGAPAVFRTRQLPRYFVRSAIGIGSMLCGFWAIGHLPMAQAISLSYSTPLFVTIFAAIWLGEIVRRRRWSAVLLGFAGVLVIVRPGTDGFSAGSLVAVAAAVLSSVVAIQIKQLSRVDPPDTIVFWTYVFWVPLSLVPALFAWQWPQGMQWPWLVAIGAFGTGGQLLWTRALKLGEVSALTPIGFMQLPLVTVLAWLLFDEGIDRWTVLGAAIILAANAYIAHREARLSKRRASIAASKAAEPGT